MKATIHVMFLAAIATIVTAAQARVGETPDQFTARYGEPVEKLSDDELLYAKGEFTITASFHEGRAEYVLYIKIDKSALGGVGDISDNEVAIILESNSNGRQWNRTPRTSPDIQWVTSDATLLAYYAVFKKALLICTKDYAARQWREIKSQEAEALEGF